MFPHTHLVTRFGQRQAKKEPRKGHCGPQNSQLMIVNSIIYTLFSDKE